MGRLIPDDVLGRVRDLAMDHMSVADRSHGPDHVTRVENLVLSFAGQDCDASLVSLIALLHDADDYKFFTSSDRSLPHAARIMRAAGVPDRIAAQVRRELRTIGYSARLAGKAPSMKEAMAVSDAEMCDSMGATGIVRMIEYAAPSGDLFFDPDDAPCCGLTAEAYKARTHETPVRHMFEKTLKLPALMQTEQGRVEARKRFRANVDFLKALFREQDAYEWADSLDQFLENLERPVPEAPKKAVHTCIGVYPNMEYKINYVADADLPLNIEYNKTMRPGRYYFVDGAYACGGIDASEEKIAELADYVESLGIPDRDEPERPYR